MKSARQAVRFAEPKPLKLSEADVSAQLVNFLESRGWRMVRMNRGLMQNAYGGVVQFGSPGMPDWLGLYYVRTESLPGACVALWCETKAPGVKAKCRCATKKPRQRCQACDQAAFRDRERARGAIVWQVDNIDWFMKAYADTFGYLHQGELAVGQSVLAGMV